MHLEKRWLSIQNVIAASVSYLIAATLKTFLSEILEMEFKV